MTIVIRITLKNDDELEDISSKNRELKDISSNKDDINKIKEWVAHRLNIERKDIIVTIK